jgi:hypothetical protein
MCLHDILRVCLLALASRYPTHSIDVNETLLESFAGEGEGWTAEEMIRRLEAMHPDLLEQRASLLIEETICAIYLPEYSLTEPTFHLHCRGRIPEVHKHTQREKTLHAVC